MCRSYILIISLRIQLNFKFVRKIVEILLTSRHKSILVLDNIILIKFPHCIYHERIKHVLVSFTRKNSTFTYDEADEVLQYQVSYNM